MLPEYRDSNYEDKVLQCSNCSWKGKAADAILIDFFGVSKNKELHCPNCDTTIAIITTDEGGTPGGSASDLNFQTE